jgi:hypothetical protein
VLAVQREPALGVRDWAANHTCMSGWNSRDQARGSGRGTTPRKAFWKSSTGAGAGVWPTPSDADKFFWLGVSVLSGSTAGVGMGIAGAATLSLSASETRLGYGVVCPKCGCANEWMALSGNECLQTDDVIGSLPLSSGV